MVISEYCSVRQHIMLPPPTHFFASPPTPTPTPTPTPHPYSTHPITHTARHTAMVPGRAVFASLKNSQCNRGQDSHGVLQCNRGEQCWLLNAAAYRRTAILITMATQVCIYAHIGAPMHHHLDYHGNQGLYTQGYAVLRARI